MWWTLFIACYLAGGWNPLISALQAIKNKKLDVDLLMIVAAIVAAAIGQILDGALLIVIFAISGALEVIVTQRTAHSISSLLSLAPEQSNLLNDDGTTRVVNSKELQVGQRILIYPGQRIGGDGIVVDGVSEVDQQAVTGESVPVLRKVGDEVLSGTMNGTGTLTVEISRPASDTVIARIVSLVEEASNTKARTQVFIEKVEQLYSVGVIIGTLIVLFLPIVLLDYSFEQALLRAIVFMIVASPCAVVLSTMPPLLASIANAGRHGVLVKTATVMESIGHSSIIAFDKTGTLTQGAPDVTNVVPAEGYDADTVIRFAAAVERFSEHPLGQAIVRAAEARAITITNATNFRAIPGQGVEGVVEGHTVTVRRADEKSATAGTDVIVTKDDAQVGTIMLVDKIRPGAARAIDDVNAVAPGGLMLLTGDNASAASTVARHIDLGSIHTELLPENKAHIVAELERDDHRVLFVGDGINDAPGLMAASTGIAMGRRGSNLALEAADAVIVYDDLSAVAPLIKLSRRARRYVVANLCIAAAVIITLVTWDLLGTLPLPLAVAGHESSTVIVAVNGIRLLRKSVWED
ncbi:heavy metal translocating P-type ATPase [Corynebacterium kroppenstedtii]|uniref:Putative cadmium-transporting ATPase n=1 Tax=Corynebacterium kroppenstedtii (strain DSM 44385 / JCM 11950 / CIP 105744 / CCUG 35717) TaxID=645127 RepID=C4LHC0_CORK4|nr:heavy metal translocating P-type ATPase [Corynebacterium kroppenstedtii]ACR17225.1 putative cadmium-transporting ATPase [Corynebacterium kroppenstedtii DSM 44385]